MWEIEGGAEDFCLRSQFPSEAESARAGAPLLVLCLDLTLQIRSLFTPCGVPAPFKIRTQATQGERRISG